MTDSNLDPETSTERDSSRRSFMKKGALASGALALGLGASGSAAAQQQSRVLLFAYDYYPGASFNVVAPLQTSTTVDILDGPNDQGVPEISQPDEYNGYVINFTLGNRPVHSFVFTRRNLQRDRSYRLSTDAQVFSTQLNLLEANIGRGGMQDTETETGTETETEEN